LNQAKQSFGALPQDMVSETNPITPEKARLGKSLTGMIPEEALLIPIIPSME
jgi:hypothetical protein